MDPFLFVAFIICLHLGLMFLIAKRYLDMIWGLILMSILIALVAGLKWGVGGGEWKTLITGGAFYLADSIVIFIFGCMFGRAMLETKIIENIVKKAVELGGGQPFLTVLLAFFASAYVMTGVLSVPGTIATGLIVLPMYMMLGLSVLDAAALHAFAQAISYVFMPSHYISQEVRYRIAKGTVIPAMGPYMIAYGATLVILGIVYVYIRFKMSGVPLRKSVLTDGGTKEKVSAPKGGPPIYSMLVPAIPMILIFGFQVDAVIAFFVSVVCAVVLTQQGSGRKVQDLRGLLTKIWFDGIKDSVPIVGIQIGVGIIAQLSVFPQVMDPVTVVTKSILPATPLMFLLFFSVWQFLSMYRGLGHQIGLGAVFYTAMAALPTIPMPAFVAMLTANNTFRWTATPDQANVVWLGGHLGVSPTDITFKSKAILWSTLVGVIGLVWAVILYGPLWK